MSEERINDPETEQVASADPPNNTKELPNTLSSPDSEVAPSPADPPNNT